MESPEKHLTIEKGGHRPRSVGIFNIIAGAIFGLGGLILSLATPSTVAIAGWKTAYIIGGISVVRTILGTVSLIGGIYALKGKCWGLAFTGAIVNLALLIGIMPVMSAWGTPMLFFTGWVPVVVDIVMILILFVMNIIAITYVITAKKDFVSSNSSNSTVTGTLRFSFGLGILLIGYIVIVTIPAITMYFGQTKVFYLIFAVLFITLGVIAIIAGLRSFLKAKS